MAQTKPVAKKSAVENKAALIKEVVAVNKERAEEKKQKDQLIEMTSENVGVKVLESLITELKRLEEPWEKMSQMDQGFVIDRLRETVKDTVRQAVRIIESHGRVLVDAKLEQITIKDGIKALLTVPQRSEGAHALVDNQGKYCLLVIDGVEPHLKGIDSIQGEPDQPSLV